MAPQRIRSVEDRSVPVDLSAGRALGGQHEKSRDACRKPTEALACHSQGKTHLLIVLANGRLDRANLRLDLADEEAPRLGMKAEEIDGSTFAVSRVCNFGCDLPSEGGQTLRKRTHKGRMVFVEQPVNGGAAPAKRDVNLGVERGGDPADGSQCQDVKMSALAA
jgi:hypothetical protein